MKELEIYQQCGKKIEEYLRPASFPLAIKLMKAEDEIPAGAKNPSANLKVQNFICQNLKIARNFGWTIAVRESDCSCKIARSVYGWDPLTPEARQFANDFAIGLYAKDAATASQWFDALHYVRGKCAGILISPLVRTKIIPDVIQIYGLPAQIMRLVQSYLFMVGGTMAFTSLGRAGSCHEGIIKTINEDLPQVVLLGNGDRVWGGADDTEILFSIPASKLELIVNGLEQTHNAGLRYPIPKYMNYAPGFQAKFAQKVIARSGGTLVKDN